MIKWAKWYCKQGFGVIPIKNKRPIIKWRQYQERQSTIEEIREWWGHTPNAQIGLVTGKHHNLTVVDLDSEDAISKLNEVAGDSFMTLIAATPRGGQHWYFRYTPDFANKAGLAEHIDIRNDGGYIVAPPSVNSNSKPYQWLKSDIKNINNDISIMPANIRKYLISLKLDKYSSGNKNLVTGNDVSGGLNFASGSRDQTLFHVANCLTKGGMLPNETEQLLTILATSVCNPPFPLPEAQAKVKSALERKEEYEKSTMQQVREFIGVAKGTFRVTDVEQFVSPTAPGRKRSNKPILMALSRLVKEGSVERLMLPATYRIIDRMSSPVHIRDVGEPSWLDFALPFGLHRYVKLAPGNLVVFAGVTNAGKSAILLNMIRENMGLHRCVYISSEMSKEIVRGRIMKYDDKRTNWDFEILDNWDQSPDVVQQGRVNFLDWVEAGEEPYRVADRLSKLQSKTAGTGLVVVAMQKNQAKGHAIGGEQTMAKASLYVNIDPDYPGAKMTVMKAKAFEDINPNGFSVKFKIVKGINLIKMTEWGPELAATERKEAYYGKQ